MCALPHPVYMVLDRYWERYIPNPLTIMEGFCYIAQAGYTLFSLCFPNATITGILAAVARL